MNRGQKTEGKSCSFVFHGWVDAVVRVLGDADTTESINTSYGEDSSLSCSLIFGALPVQFSVFDGDMAPIYVLKKKSPIIQMLAHLVSVRVTGPVSPAGELRAALSPAHWAAPQIQPGQPGDAVSPAGPALLPWGLPAFQTSRLDMPRKSIHSEPRLLGPCDAGDQSQLLTDDPTSLEEEQ